MSLALHYWMRGAHHCSGPPVSEMTYSVSSGTLNSTIPYHTIPFYPLHWSLSFYDNRGHIRRPRIYSLVQASLLAHRFHAASASLRGRRCFIPRNMCCVCGLSRRRLNAESSSSCIRDEIYRPGSLWRERATSSRKTSRRKRKPQKNILCSHSTSSRAGIGSV